MNKKGFTLVELLAVIVILAIILAVAIPTISSIVDNSKRNAFEASAKLLLKAVRIKLLENSNFDLTTINKNTLESLLNIDSDNYSQVYVRNDSNGKLYTTLKGTGQWDNLTASGSLDSMTVGVTESIVIDQLSIYLDAGNTASYGGTGNTWYDISGNGKNGTLNNGVGYSSLNGGSMVLDGVDDYVSVARTISDDFTLECFFKSNQGIGTSTSWYLGAGLMDAEMSGITNDFGMSLNSQGRVLAGTGNPDTFVYTNTGYNNNVVHHVAFTRVKTSGLISIYVDGALAMTATGGVTSLNTPSRITIGRLQTDIYSLSANIYVARIYSKALSSVEIQQNFNAQKTRYGL